MGLQDVLKNIRTLVNLIEVKPGVRANHDYISIINQNLDAIEQAIGEQLEMKEEVTCHDGDDQPGQDV